MVRKWITFFNKPWYVQFLKQRGFGAMFNGEKDRKVRRWRRYGCNITPVRLSVLVLASLSQVSMLGDRVQKPTAPSWMGNGSSTLSIPTSLNIYMWVYGGRTHRAFRQSHTSTSPIRRNKQQLWAASIPGDRACWDMWLRLCGIHTTSWAAKATTSSMITHHPYLSITISSISLSPNK